MRKHQAEVGTAAPDFTLLDDAGEKWRLSSQRGKVVVLLFYPGDETPVCTRQMCSLRNRWSDYALTGAEVVGISTNTVESHRSFAAHHQLPLKLLADEGRKVADAYGARSLIPGKVARSVFIIDANGRERLYFETLDSNNQPDLKSQEIGLEAGMRQWLPQP